jgi:hypothetical protein
VEKDDAHRDEAGIGKGPDRKAGREEGNFQWIVLSQVHVVGPPLPSLPGKERKTDPLSNQVRASVHGDLYVRVFSQVKEIMHGFQERVVQVDISII